MPFYAQINGDSVVVAVTESAGEIDDESMIEIEHLDGSLLGRVYSGPNQFDEPEVEEVRHITTLAFLSRFTDPEAIEIDLASLGATQQAATLRRYKEKVSAARYIDLDRSDTRAGVQALEVAGLLGAGRALMILDAEIEASERP